MSCRMAATYTESHWTLKRGLPARLHDTGLLFRTELSLLMVRAITSIFEAFVTPFLVSSQFGDWHRSSRRGIVHLESVYNQEGRG